MALLARTVGADVLVIATDVEHAVLDFGTDRARPLGRVAPAELRSYAAAGRCRLPRRPERARGQRADRSWTKCVSRASWSGSVEGITPCPRLKM